MLPNGNLSNSLFPHGISVRQILGKKFSADDSVAPLTLGPVEIEIGNLNIFAQKTQRKTFLSNRRKGRHAEARRNPHIPAFPDNAHFPQGVCQTFRNASGRFQLKTGGKDQKLLPSITTDNVFLPQIFPEYLRNPTQNLVAALVAEVVVNALEVVDIAHDQGGRTPAA